MRRKIGTHVNIELGDKGKSEIVDGKIVGYTKGRPDVLTYWNVVLKSFTGKITTR